MQGQHSNESIPEVGDNLEEYITNENIQPQKERSSPPDLNLEENSPPALRKASSI